MPAGAKFPMTLQYKWPNTPWMISSANERSTCYAMSFGGQSNKIIAAELALSEHTVKNHPKNILSKLNADDRTHAVTIALRRGYIDL
jgi:DNA-binding NarL/FixJ family response regulator